MFSWSSNDERTLAFFSSPTEMPHSYEHIVEAQQSSVGDELYNLTQLAEVSIVYFRHHTATIIDGPSAYEKVTKVRATSTVIRTSCTLSLKIGLRAIRFFRHKLIKTN